MWHYVCLPEGSGSTESLRVEIGESMSLCVLSPWCLQLGLYLCMVHLRNGGVGWGGEPPQWHPVTMARCIQELVHPIQGGSQACTWPVGPLALRIARRVCCAKSSLIRKIPRPVKADVGSSTRCLGRNWRVADVEKGECWLEESLNYMFQSGCIWWLIWMVIEIDVWWEKTAQSWVMTSATLTVEPP